MNTSTIIKPTKTYRIARTLHWLCAIFFVLLVFSMPFMLDQAHNSTQRADVYMVHQSIATMFFILLVCRFIWLLTTATTGTAIVFEHKWQFIIARINHIILYFLMFSMPITGLVSRIAGGKIIDIFGIQLIPVFEVLINKDIKFYTNESHLLLINLFYISIFLHLIGALSHIFQQKVKAYKKVAII